MNSAIFLIFLFQCVLSQNIKSNINEPMEITQAEAQVEDILGIKSAIISNEQILQIRAEADAMFDSMKTIIAPTPTVEADSLSIVVCSRHSNCTSIPITAAKQIYTLTSFNASLSTIMFIFGWTSGPDKEGTAAVRDGILQNADANVLIVDWSNYTQTLNYFDAQKSVEKTGEFLGQFLAELIEIYSVDLITMVGHSLGAHVAGFAGRCINGSIPVIVALDPAGPLYCKNEPSKRLNTGDAVHVMTLHTSYLGMIDSIGHSDFFPNGGMYQKGCTEFMCSHIRALYLYIESLFDSLYPGLYGRKCENNWIFAFGFCNLNEQNKFGGIHVDTTANGDYRFCTNSEPPYGQGMM